MLTTDIIYVRGGAQGVKVTGVDVRKRRVHAVRWTSSGAEGVIECEAVVNCGGQWARTLGRGAGVTVPLYAAEHFYLVTKPLVDAFNWLGNLVLKPFGIPPAREVGHGDLVVRTAARLEPGQLFLRFSAAA